jgi:NAD-dependent dihydropyrimidine dehydrogenase PreA subunit
MFDEKGLRAHLYLCIAGLVFLILFFGYVFWFEHKEKIQGDWEERFENAGLTKEQISDITHDDSMWYYQRMSTCVGYGNPEDKCPSHESYCSNGNTFGSFEKQASEVSKSIKKGGVHEDCPLIYSGAD